MVRQSALCCGVRRLEKKRKQCLKRIQLRRKQRDVALKIESLSLHSEERLERDSVVHILNVVEEKAYTGFLCTVVPGTLREILPGGTNYEDQYLIP